MMATKRTQKTGRGYVAFIDLLGTKESHRVSNASFEEAIETFCVVLAQQCVTLSENKSKVYHFSDCAFVFTNESIGVLYSYLNNVRQELLTRNLYFKCGVAIADEKILDGAQAENIVFKNTEKSMAEDIKNKFEFRLFGPEIIDAYLLHEQLKGVGFNVQKNLGVSYPEYFVNSVFVSESPSGRYSDFYDFRENSRLSKCIGHFVSERDDEGNDNVVPSYASKFHDARALCRIKGLFSGKTLAYIEFTDEKGDDDYKLRNIVMALRKSYLRDKTYPKYYLSLLITIVHSSCFDHIWYDKERRRWMGYPYVFYFFILTNWFQRSFRRYRDFELLLTALVSRTLMALDYRRYVAYRLGGRDCKKHLLAYEKHITEKYLTTYIDVDVKRVLEDVTNNFKEYLQELDTQEILDVCDNTEEQVLDIFIKKFGSRIAGGLGDVPYSILNGWHRSRIEARYAESVD